MSVRATDKYIEWSDLPNKINLISVKKVEKPHEPENKKKKPKNKKDIIDYFAA